MNIFEKTRAPSYIVLLLLLQVVVSLAAAFYIEIHPDTAAHWLWAQHLRLSYYEHPPAIAYFIRFFSVFFNNDILAIKFGTIISSLLIIASAFLAASTLTDKTSAFYYIILLCGTPFFFFLNFFWYSGHLLLIFWFLSLWTFGKYIKSANTYWFLLMGVFAGLGVLSEYTMIFFYIIVIIWCFFYDEKALYSYNFWMAGLLSLLIFSPVIYWNYQNDWVSFLYQLNRGFSNNDSSIQIISFTLGHIFLFSFFISIPALYCFVRGSFLWQNIPIYRLLKIHFLVPFIFFSFASLFGKVADPNWMKIGYISLLLLLAIQVYKWQKDSRRKFFSVMFIGSIVVNITFVVVLILHLNYQIFSIKNDRSNELNGWKDTASAIQKVFKTQETPIPPYLITREYQLGAIVSLYSSNDITPYSLQKAERNQWIEEDIFNETDFFMLCEPKNCERITAEIIARFSRTTKKIGSFTIQRRNNVIRKLEVWNTQ